MTLIALTLGIALWLAFVGTCVWLVIKAGLELRNERERFEGEIDRGIGRGD